MTATRQQVCERTASRLDAAAPGLGSIRAVVGLDGFVDEIIEVVETRFGPDSYRPFPTIAALAEKIRAAAGTSSNFELVVRRQKLGGNGPILAHALASMGLDVAYIGSLGHPEIHPVFRELAARARVHSVAEPGHTDALEFRDGKLMLGKSESLRELDWDHLVARVGRPELRRLLGESALIAMVNWTMIPAMTRIWERLLEEIVPSLDRADRTLFVDLADPEKRTPDDLREALDLLRRFQGHLHVVLGLNAKEAVGVASALGLPTRPDPEAAGVDEAEAIRATLGLGTVLIHPRQGASAATAGASARFAGPFVQRPLISTGAGDHFNAGFCLAHALGLGLEECLCVGVAASGFYVRSARSPSAGELAGFIAALPPPEG